MKILKLKNTTSLKTTAISFSNTLFTSINTFPKHLLSSTSFLSEVQNFYSKNTSCNTLCQRLQMHIIPNIKSDKEATLKVDTSILSTLNKISKYFNSLCINQETKIGNYKSADINSYAYYFSQGKWWRGLKVDEEKFTEVREIKIDDKLPYDFFTGIISKLSALDQQFNQIINNINSTIDQLMQSKINFTRLVNDYAQDLDLTQNSLYKSHI